MVHQTEDLGDQWRITVRDSMPLSAASHRLYQLRVRLQ